MTSRLDAVSMLRPGRPMRTEGIFMRCYSRLMLSSVAVLFSVILASGSLFAAPTITSGPAPSQAQVNTYVEIIGTGFGSSQGSSTVKVNGTVANYFGQWASTQ